MKFKQKLISAACATGCCFLIQTATTQAKETSTHLQDVLISYKDHQGKQYAEQHVEHIEKHLGDMKMVRANVNTKQYRLLKNNPHIEWVKTSTDKMHIASTSTIKSVAPNYKPKWNMNYVKAPTYWKKGYLGKGVKVAIIDTGVNEIEGLGNVVKRISFAKDNPATKDIDESDPYDRGNYGDGHGTSVAAILGSQLDKKTQSSSHLNVAGVAPNIRIYSLKYADGTSNGQIGDMIEAIQWSIKHHMQIINISSSIYTDHPGLKKAINQAAKKGIIIVASAGNDGPHDAPTYPARYENVIGVASIGKDKKSSPFSNRGASVDFAAPGDDVATLNVVGEKIVTSGTSFAAPHVTGLVALLIERYPNSSSTTIINKLKKSALDLGAKGKDSKYGYGLAQLPKIPTKK